MKVVRIAALIAVILMTGGAFADDSRLGTNVQPTYQVIDLKIDPSTDSYRGSTRISLKIAEETTSIRLQAEDIEISKVALDGPKGSIRVSHRVEKDLLTIRSQKPLAPGSYGLRIEFSNEFNTQAVGLYRVEAGGDGYAYTQFEAIDARKAFPCWDEPSFKIPFQLRITAREDHEVVTNTPVRYESTRKGWRTVEFHTTKPLPTYLLAIAVGPMDSIEIPNLSVPGRIYTPKGQAELATYSAKLVDPILRAQEKYFDMKYPYKKLDFIAIPEYWPGAMEHPGAITYKDTILLLDANRVSAGQRRNVVRVISHELAHMWFGDLVTMEWWDDLWLNEAFADWLGDKIVVRLYPEMKHDLNELRGVNGVMNTDARVTSEPIRKPIQSASDMLGNVGLAYNKGKTVIGMFERWIGPETFRKGVNSYLRKNAWGNARADEFWASLSAAAGADVSSAMETFLVQPGLPLVEASTEGNTVIITQKRFANYGADVDAQTWRIPVGIRVGSGAAREQKTVLVSTQEERVEFARFDSIDWVMPNLEASGYYRWTVGDDQLVALAENATTALTERERVSFLGNLGALLDAGLTGGDTYMKILGIFANDPEPLVVSAVISELNGVDQAFVTDDLQEGFSAYVAKMLTPAIERFGIEARSGEDETVTGFRPRLLAWLGDVGQDEKVLAYGRETASAYMDDPTSVDPAIAAVCLALVAKNGDADLFADLKTRFMEAKNPGVRATYLGSLGRFENPEIRDEALAFVLTGPLRPNELFTIPGGVGGTVGGQDLIFDWMTEHWDAISSKLPPVYLPYLTQIAGGCEIDRLTKGKEFFSQPEHSVEGTEQALKRVEAGVLDCVDLRQREGAKVRAYLESY